MSNRALTWAFEREIHSSSEKFVLVAMADVADNRSSASYPSVTYLVECTALDRKTVIRAVAALEEAGFITDTGERVGKTRQIKVYRIMLEPTDQHEDNDTENGHLASVTVRKRSANSPLTVPKESLKSPKNGTRNHESEPEPLNLKEEGAVALAPEGARPLPPLTSDDVWQQRLDGYDPHNIRKTWKPFWGARPDAPGQGHLIPRDMHRQWLAKHKAKEAA